MATVHSHPHEDPHDDDSLLGDDLIEADDGELLTSHYAVDIQVS